MLLALTSMVLNPAYYTHVNGHYCQESLSYQFLNQCYLLAVDFSLQAYDFSGVVYCRDDVKDVEEKTTRLCEPCFTGFPARYILNSYIKLAIEITRLVERAVGINSQRHIHQLLESNISFSGPDYIELHSASWMTPLVDLLKFLDAVRTFYMNGSSKFIEGNQRAQDTAREAFERQCVEAELLKKESDT